MNFKTLTFVFSILIVTTYGKSLSVKGENTEKDGTVRIDPIEPIIVDSNMKSKVQQEIIEELKRIYVQNPEDKRCQQWALSVAEKQKTKFACFKYEQAGDPGAHYIDRSAQYIKLHITDGSSKYPETYYLLFAIKRYK